MLSSVAGCQGCKKQSGAGLAIWMDLFLFRGQGVTTISWNVISPQGRSLKHGPMCSPLEGNKPLSHKESMNKVRARLAVGINVIHPLLIVPPSTQRFGWRKRPHCGGETKKRSTMSFQRMLSLFYRIRFCPARGHFPCVCAHLSSS